MRVLRTPTFGGYRVWDRSAVVRAAARELTRRADGEARRTSARDAGSMHILTLADAPAYDPERVVAQPFLDGPQSNVRVIRLSPGQNLPPHTHDPSDLMLYAVEGEGVLTTEDGPVGFGAGSLAFYRGDEELRLANEGTTGLTLFAFLAPPFPPRSDR